MTTQEKGTEFYPTPRDLAQNLWEKLLWQIPGDYLENRPEDSPPQFLEPSAGRGVFAEVMAKHGRSVVTAIDPNFEDPGIEGVEWGQMSLEVLHEALEGERPFDAACGNPPFTLAEAHLRLIFNMLAPGGHVGFLLRLGFLASKSRAKFFAAYPPKHIYVMTSRPSFMWSYKCKVEYALSLGGADVEGEGPTKGCGHKWLVEPGNDQKKCPKCGNKNLQVSKTDQYDYCFIVWQPDMKPGTQTTLSFINTYEGAEDV